MYPPCFPTSSWPWRVTDEGNSGRHMGMTAAWVPSPSGSAELHLTWTPPLTLNRASCQPLVCAVRLCFQPWSLKAFLLQHFLTHNDPGISACSPFFPHALFSFCLPAPLVFLQLRKPIILEVGRASDGEVFKFYKIKVVYQGWSLRNLGELLQVKDYQILNTVSGTKALKSNLL